MFWLAWGSTGFMDTEDLNVEIVGIQEQGRARKAKFNRILSNCVLQMSSKRTYSKKMPPKEESCKPLNFTPSKIWMPYIKPCSQKITVGDGRHLKVKKPGKMRICLKCRERKTIEVLLVNVNYVPEIEVNLFSLTVAMEKRASLYSKGPQWCLKEGKEIFFDTKIKMGSSFLIAVKSIINEAAFVISERNEMKIEILHQMLGHQLIEMTRETAKRIGLKVTGSLKECNNFMLAKMRRKNIKQTAKNYSKIPGERLLLDISFIKKISLGKRNI